MRLCQGQHGPSLLSRVLQEGRRVGNGVGIKMKGTEQAMKV